MTGRYFNWKLALVFVLGLVILGATAYGVRQWQRSRRAQRGLVQGNKAYSEKKWRDAAVQLGRYLVLSPNDVPVLLKYAESQLKIRPLQARNVRRAVTAYRSALRLDAQNAEAAERLAELYLNTGMPGEAELVVTRTLETNKSPKLQRMLAISLASQRKFKDAAGILEAVVKEHPDEVLAYGVLGRLVEQRPEDFAKPAGFWFDEAVKNNPQSAQAYGIRGAYNLRRADKAGALADFAEAEKLDLSDINVRLWLAEQFISAGVFEKAQKHLEIVEASNPADELLWQVWGELALKSGSNELMLRAADRGLERLSSDVWDFLPVAAEMYIRNGEFKRAQECISKLRENNAAVSVTLFLEGLLADAQGRGYEAVDCWRRAVESGGESVRVRLALADVLSRLGDKQSAIKQLRLLVAEQPGFVAARVGLAKLLGEVGRWAEAAQEAGAAMQAGGGSVEAALLYVRARLYLLSQSAPNNNSAAYQEIEKQLVKLDEATDGAIEVKILQFQLAIQRRDLAGAQQVVDEMKKNHSSLLQTAFAQTDLLVAQEKPDDAVVQLRQAVAAFPQQLGLLRYLAALLALQGRWDECESEVKGFFESAQRTPAKIQAGLVLADVYDVWGRQEKRCEFLGELSGVFTDDIRVQREVLTCVEVLKDTRRSQEIVDRIKNIEGQDGWQWRYEQARVWSSPAAFESKYPQIVAMLKENLLVNPEEQGSRMLLAATYERRGELRLAVSTYIEALARSPKDVRIVVPAVAALYRANEYDQADEILQRAARERLYHPELERLALQSHVRRGDISSADALLEKMLVRDPNNRSVCLSLALLKIQQGRFTEAETLVNKLRGEEPNSVPIAAATSELNVRRGRPQEAVQVCDEMVNKLGSASAYLLRGRTYAVLRQAENASKDFERVVTIEPNNPDGWLAKSVFYRSVGESEKAIADIRRALSLSAGDVRIQKAAVIICMSSADSEVRRDGERVLEQALQSSPADVDLRLQKARLLFAKGTARSIEEGTALLQGINEQRPDVAEAWGLLGEVALRQGRPARAIDLALRGLVQRPNDKALLLLKARGEAARSPGLAIPTLKALHELDPNDIDVAVYLADLYVTTGGYKDAITLLRAQLASSGDDLQQRRLKLALAAALYKGANKTESEQLFEQLHRSEPNDATILISQTHLLRDDKLWGPLRQKVVAWCDEHPGDVNAVVYVADDLASVKDNQAGQTAEELLRKILEQNPGSVAALARLGMLLQTNGRSAEAETVYRQILESQPENVVALNNLAWILCEGQNQHKEALELTQRGLAKTPDYVDLIDTRGVAYYRLGEFEKAARDLNECVSLYPAGTAGAATSRFHLARALAQLGQKKEAVENLKTSIELNGESGGLGAEDIAEAQRLLDELSRGGS